MAYWNPEEVDGKSYPDALIYDKRYYDAVEAPKYVAFRNIGGAAIAPTDQTHYPRIRDERAFYHRQYDIQPGRAASEIYKKYNGGQPDRDGLFYLRSVYPPTYYQMWS